MKMKWIGCLALMLLLAFAAGLAQAETVSFGGVTVDTDAAYVDMGDMVITDWNGFYAFLDSLTKVKKVDMFGTEVKKPKIEEMAARYPEIEFGWTMRIVEHTIRTDQTAFSTLHGDPSDPVHTGDDFSIL